MNNYKLHIITGVLFVAFLFAVINTLVTIAEPNGRANRTSTLSNGCGSGTQCHGSIGTAVTVSLTNGPLSVEAGAVVSYTIKVEHASLSNAGIGIAIKRDENSSPGENAGTLAPGTGSGLTLKGTPQELTQSTPKNMSGGSASFNFTWTAPTTPGTYFLRAIGLAGNNNGSASGDTWNRMTIQQITVTAPSSVTVSLPNGNEQICQGSVCTIAWTASAVSNVKIELSGDGGSSYPVVLASSVAANAGTWQWNVPANQAPGSNYRVRISDVSNANIKDASNASFSVLETTSITSEPVSLNICQGQPAQFSVVAKGSGLFYQWRRNGKNITGAISRTYSFTPIPSDTGNFDVVVRGTCGSDTSQPASLNLKINPEILKQPLPVNATEDTDVQFLFSLKGSNMTFQWQKNGVNLGGETDSVLSMKNVQIFDTGSYSCQVTHPCGTITSNKVYLTVVKKQPGARIALALADCGFGTVILPSSKDSLITGLVQNTGTDTLSVRNIEPIDNDTSDFEVVSSKNFKLPPGKAIDLTLRFKPKTGGAKNTNLKFFTNTTTDPTMYLSGFAGFYNTVAIPDTLDFKTIMLGDSSFKSLIIENNGNLPETINSYTITGPGASDFTLESPLVFLVNLDPGLQTQSRVIFKPSGISQKTAFLEFVPAKQQSNIRTVLLGNGTPNGTIDEIMTEESVYIYPNPFIDKINIIPKSDKFINFIVYDIFGNEIRNLDIKNNAGSGFEWDGTDSENKLVPAGIYLVRIFNTGSEERFIVLKLK